LAASTFFTSLLEQVNQAGERSDLNAAQKESLKPLLNQRDDLITLLARSDPAAADRLAEMYMAFSKAGLQP
jgi:DNA-binding FadR family transcriptional regulator